MLFEFLRKFLELIKQIKYKIKNKNKAPYLFVSEGKSSKFLQIFLFHFITKKVI